MRIFDSDAADSEVLAIAHEWADRLAAADYAGACALLAPDAHWTPANVERWIQGYGSGEPLPDGEVMRVTPRATATGDLQPRHEITRPDPAAAPPEELSSGRPVGSYGSLLNATPGFLGEVWYDLPLNGEWSDLVARLWIVPVDGGFALQLRVLNVP